MRFRAFVYMNNLLNDIQILHKVAIVNEKGELRGYLRVVVEPLNSGSASNGTMSLLNFRREDPQKQKAQASNCFPGKNSSGNPTGRNFILSNAIN